MIRIATRGSALARWQAERVGALLGEPVEYVLVSTTGDRDQTLRSARDRRHGVFVKEVQQAVLDGRADVAVHSAKDLPVRRRRPGSCSRRFPSAAIRATRSSVRRSKRSRPAGASAPARCAGGRSSRPRVPISCSRRCAATSRRGCASAPTRATTRSWSRSPRSTASGSRDQVDRGARPDGDAAAGRAGRARGRVPRRRRATHGAARGDRRSRRAPSRFAPSGRSSPSSAAAATCRAARSRASTSATGEIVLDALLAALDGHVVLRTRVAGTDPVEVGARGGARSARRQGRPRRARRGADERSMTVYLVGAGPGDPGLLTRRGEELLRARRRRRLRPARLAARCSSSRRPAPSSSTSGKAPGPRRDDAGADQRAARRRAARPGSRSCG